MTLDKIIQGLKAVRTIHNGNYTPQIDSAIHILQQIKPELEPCEDCVSREAALETVEEQKKGFYGVERYAIDECYSAIMKLPLVSPQRPKGEWIVNSCVRRNDVYHYTVHCDKCGQIWDYTTDKKDSKPSDYCPNCGAEMEDSND